MKLRQYTSNTVKGKLSTTLKSWLPILQTGLFELEDEFKKFEEDNPVLEVKSGFEKSFNSLSKDSGSSDMIETFSISDKSLYDVLYEQVTYHLFPTKRSQDIAYEIIGNIDDNGYFDNSTEALAEKLGHSSSEIERVRQRFAYLEPLGIASKDMQESFIFQLMHLDLDDELNSLIESMIESFDNMYKFDNHKRYNEALTVIQKFKTPPAIEYQQKELEVIPDLFISVSDGFIEVNLNDRFYPSVKVNLEDFDKNLDFIKMKVKEAKDLVDALEMRKATVYKIGLMLVEHQYEFFTGGDIKPMKLKDLADDLEYNQSTISRAISNKYLECERGVFALKNFFSTAIDSDLSNTSIKEYIKKVIKDETKDKPYSDMKILELTESKFSVKLSRRTITKYRKQLNIPSSSERKKLYKVSV
jgi:RNA polymerase sigma-54 factor